ncbi:uncharacterized protein B0H18DRAFT_1119840 [Fomitopsis serialis]|uniref:uncharacterized protein n=1 Tax=Fomitopsis serialis TaxID=139415 RepID=UPI0020085604|nr:uncharacterized protein B0H18DRAFT_1119840 [Neoantrodia serialis]KAH9924494.1 hypothetical protein B0H18DRAFT_1119840 [Neoantrodia serialis]
MQLSIQGSDVVVRTDLTLNNTKLTPPSRCSTNSCARHTIAHFYIWHPKDVWQVALNVRVQEGQDVRYQKSTRSSLPRPSAAQVKAAEEHIEALERRWVERCVAELGPVSQKDAEQACIPLHPPRSASKVIHLPFPSSPTNPPGSLNALMPLMQLIESLHLRRPFVDFGIPSQLAPAAHCIPRNVLPFLTCSVRIYSHRSTSATFLPPSPPSSNTSTSSSSLAPSVSSSAATSGTSMSTPLPASYHTRPAKILIFSADGYTESSVRALTLLMAWRKLSLPKAYLCLWNEKRRSFFVYSAGVSALIRRR